MFAFLDKLLAPPPADRARIAPGAALAALMVEAARSDGDYADSERAEIEATLAALLAMPPADAAALRQQGEAAQAGAPDLVRFTRALKAAFPYEERSALMEALWRVALADGNRADEESALMRKLAPLLGVSDRDSAAARQRAGG